MWQIARTDLIGVSKSSITGCYAYLSVLLDHGDISLDGLLAILGLPSLGSLGEGLLLGVVPASVESSLGFVGDVVGPDGL